jgi:uncharacterized membrane protein YsdA (DUF1294 family)
MNGIFAGSITTLFGVYLCMHDQFIALAIYTAVSLILFILYWIDKRAAVMGKQRIPEFNLHVMAILGGWPGAWAAQKILRHKTIKKSFQAVFIATVIVNILGFKILFFPN